MSDESRYLLLEEGTSVTSAGSSDKKSGERSSKSSKCWPTSWDTIHHKGTPSMTHAPRGSARGTLCFGLRDLERRTSQRSDLGLRHVELRAWDGGRGRVVYGSAATNYL